jgi:HD-GYP domain-containing protein (c-di-GMP phosphodiesterase class II)
MLALSQPTTLDSRDQLDAQGLPEQYPSRLNAVAGVPIVGLPDLKATLFAINSKRGTYTKDELVMGKLLAQELGRCLLLRDLALTGDQARISATESLLAAAEAKRPGSRTQARECARFAEAIARELGWEEAQVQEIRLAALLHDVGELAVPDPLLDKPAPLTPEEFEIVRQHPRHASRIIDFFNRSDLVLTAVLNHHERWDGRGYPSGLGGEDIPQAGRILCLADAMESMLSSKVYRPGFTSTQALQEVLLGSGTQFDPTVVQAFLAVLRREGESFLERPPFTGAPAAPPA